MSFIVEQDIENAALEILEEMGYEVVYGPTIAPDGENPLRSGWDEVVLRGRLETAIRKINSSLKDDWIEEAIKKEIGG